MWAGNGQACSQRLLSLWLGWGRCGVSPLMGVRRQRQCRPGGRLSPTTSNGKLGMGNATAGFGRLYRGSGRLPSERTSIALRPISAVKQKSL